jgi:predicted membrane-bound spermidine synthase
MQSQQFTVQGFTRTYWDFYLGAGFTVSVLYVFAAILAWQLGGLPGAVLSAMRTTAWAFTACFAAISVLSWRYLFWIPVVLSALVAACLGAAAWSSGRHAADLRHGS